ncbi:MAG: threonine synthase, partial [Nocardioidaceae bacterium]|nr:threonine synthase [Nocardioidaceae bacterium]
MSPTATSAPSKTTKTLRAGAFGNAVELACRECGATQELGPYYVCTECFGPLEIKYDFPAITREQI